MLTNIRPFSFRTPCSFYYDLHVFVITNSCTFSFRSFGKILLFFHKKRHYELLTTCHYEHPVFYRLFHYELHYEHPVFFLMSEDRNRLFYLEFVIKSWDEKSVSRHSNIILLFSSSLNSGLYTHVNSFIKLISCRSLILCNLIFFFFYRRNYLELQITVYQLLLLYHWWLNYKFEVLDRIVSRCPWYLYFIKS
jgi:hypothetical protein